MQFSCILLNDNINIPILERCFKKTQPKIMNYHRKGETDFEKLPAC